MKGGLDLTQDIAMEVFTAALVLALKLGLPVLIAAVVIGLIIAILQAATQVHEQTLSFAPKAIVSSSTTYSVLWQRLVQHDAKRCVGYDSE